MNKKYYAKIIATDNDGLRMISACSNGAKVKVSNINSFSIKSLLSIERTKIEMTKTAKDK